MAFLPELFDFKDVNGGPRILDYNAYMTAVVAALGEAGFCGKVDAEGEIGVKTSNSFNEQWIIASRAGWNPPSGNWAIRKYVGPARHPPSDQAFSQAKLFQLITLTPDQWVYNLRLFLGRKSSRTGRARRCAVQAPEVDARSSVGPGGTPACVVRLLLSTVVSIAVSLAALCRSLAEAEADPPPRGRHRP